MKQAIDSAIVSSDRQTSNRANIVIAVTLLVLAALLRFSGLGDLGFYGDEETTSYAARAVAGHEAPHMPSGMPYQRALPYSWMAGLAARYLGTDVELAYRLPAAIAGSLMVPVLFLLSLPLVGRRGALFAALLLCFSEWHILTSREARMYAPFLLCFTASALLALRWSTSNSRGHLLGALLLAGVAMTFQPLAAFVALAFLIPVVVPGASAVAPWRAVLAAIGVAAVSLAYTELIELKPYDAWKALHDVSSEGPTSTTPWWQPGGVTMDATAVIGAGIGLLLGIWIGVQLIRDTANPRTGWSRLAVVGTAAVAGASLAMGQLYGAALFMLMLLLIDGRSLPELLRRCWPMLTGLLILGAGMWIFRLATAASLYAAVRASVALPFPYLGFFAEMFPGLIALLVAMALVAVVRRGVLADNPTLRVIALLMLLPIVIMGLVSQWGGMRYLLASYPFMLLLAAAALDWICGWLTTRFPRLPRERTAWIAGTIVIASGILGGHGIAQALRATRLTYGPVADPLALGFDIYPDHRGAGRFVAGQLGPGDIVVAEDSLQQRWYVGRVDYWLRNEIESAPFLYRHQDGHLRDIYVNSAAATPAVLDALDAAAHRIWVITSGETHGKLDYYLTERQRQWLDRVASTHQPRYAGADGVTRVYCVNCADSPEIMTPERR